MFFKIKKIIKNLIVKNKNHNSNTKLLKSYDRIFQNISNIQIINTHKNNVLLIYLKKEKIYRKFSIKKNGIKKIISERNGLKWYIKKNKIKETKIIKNFHKNKQFAFLDLKKIRGEKKKSWRPLSENISCINKFFSHYKKIFKISTNHIIHGDLTLDNILFSRKNFFIIDWEFYSTKKFLWGYDLVYLVLSSVCIPYLENKVFSKKDERYFLELWLKLIKLKIDKQLLFNPFKYLDYVFLNCKPLNLSLKISRLKFFHLSLHKDFKDKIYNLINSNFGKLEKANTNKI